MIIDMASNSSLVNSGSSLDEEKSNRAEKNLQISKDIQILLKDESGYTNEEKITFANLIIKDFVDKLCSINCSECEEYYQQVAMPYQLRCGHSVCLDCHSKLSGNMCKVCSQNISGKEIAVPPPNRDLLSLALVIQNAVAIIGQSREKPELKTLTPKGGLILNGLMDLSEKVEYGIFVIKTSQDHIKASIETVQEAFDIIQEIFKSLAKYRAENNQLDRPENLLKSIWRLVEYINTFKRDITKLDDIIFSCINNTIIRNHDFHLLPTHDVIFNDSALAELKEREYDIWAYAVINERAMYSRVDVQPSFITIKSFEDFPGYSNKLYIIKYDDLQQFTASGVYFILRFEQGIEIPLYLTITDKTLFSRQMFILCSGELGPSFTCGDGSVDDFNVFFDSYCDEGDEYCADHIYGVPDVVGEEKSLEIGSVYADRELFEEVRFYISKEEKKERKMCIGNLLWEKSALADLPNESFTISECGVFFNLIVQEESSGTPKSGQPPKEPNPKSGQPPKEPNREPNQNPTTSNIYIV